MEIQYYCKNPKRLQAIKKTGVLNAIEYIEVLDAMAAVPEQRQRVLLVHCVKSIVGLTNSNIIIQGGVRRAVKVLNVSADPATIIKTPASWNSAQRGKYFASILDNYNPERVLIVETDSWGDFSTYTLKLVKSVVEDTPPDGYDPILSEINFSLRWNAPRILTVCQSGTWRFPCTPSPGLII
jgi:hypothetical protein